MPKRKPKHPHKPKHRPRKQPQNPEPTPESTGGSDSQQTVVFPAYTPPTGYETTWDHGFNWETPPNIVIPSNSDGSTWLKLEIKYLSEPTTQDVALWLQQVLRFEIGQHLAERALKLMKGQRHEFEQFAENVIEYLLRTRKPKPKHKKRAHSRGRSPAKATSS